MDTESVSTLWSLVLVSSFCFSITWSLASIALIIDDRAQAKETIAIAEANHDAAIAVRDAAIAVRDAAIAVRDYAKKMNKAITIKHGHDISALCDDAWKGFKEMVKAIETDRDQANEKIAIVEAERDAIIKAIDAKLYTVIAERDAAIAERDAIIKAIEAKLYTVIAERDAAIAERDAALVVREPEPEPEPL